MAIGAIIHEFTGDTVRYYDAYDPDKTILGDCIIQQDGYAGPLPVAVTYPMELPIAPTVNGLSRIRSIAYTSTIDWVFIAEGTVSASVSKRIYLYEFNKLTGRFSYVGNIIWTPPVGTNNTIVDFQPILVRHTFPGSTINVFGDVSRYLQSSQGLMFGDIPPQWPSTRFLTGRIGLGSTDYTQITADNWYDIIVCWDTSTLRIETRQAPRSSVPSFPCPYVIEELFLVVVSNSATLTNGGLFLTKGISYNLFTPAGSSIPAAATEHNWNPNGSWAGFNTATYWLADAEPVTQTANMGLAVDDYVDSNTHYIYCANTPGAQVVNFFKYNIRAVLTSPDLYGSITNGKTTNALVAKTGNSQVIPYNFGSFNTLSFGNWHNLTLATTNHGPGKGEKSLYWTGTQRVMRVAVNRITNGNTNLIDSSCNEVPPGGQDIWLCNRGYYDSSSYMQYASIQGIQYIPNIDRFLVNVANSNRPYLMQFGLYNAPYDYAFLSNDNRIHPSTICTDFAVYPTIASHGLLFSASGNMLYCIRVTMYGSNTNQSQLYAVPLGTHWDWANKSPHSCLISPRLKLPHAAALTRVYINETNMIGGYELGAPTDSFRLYARTQGIEDNSGIWTPIHSTGDLTNLNPSEYIQFMFTFQMVSHRCIPSRINAIGIIYEDLSNDRHFQPSASLSNRAFKQFTWRFQQAFGRSYHLKVQLYHTTTMGLIKEDLTSNPLGTFEFSNDGGNSWTTWNNNDKVNERCYLRYTPDSLADNVLITPVILEN